jgi:hypothetical protein
MAGGQSTTAFPVVITGTVTAGAGTTVVSLTGSALVSGTITAIPIDRTAATPAGGATGQIVWVANPGAAVATTTLTIQTILGTAVVSVVPGVSVTVVTQLGTQVVSVVPGLSVLASITVSAVLGTIVTLLGTVLISQVGGASISLGSMATMVGTTTATSGATGLLVWLGASQSVLGTVSLSGTTAVPSVSAQGGVMWVAGGQSTTAFPVVVSGSVAVIAGTTVVSGLITAIPGGGTAVYFGYTTAVAETTRVQPAFTIGQDMTTVAATTRYVIPAGKILVVNAVEVWARNTLASIGFGAIRVWLLASTAAFTTTAPAFAMVMAAAITSATGAPFVGVANGSIVFPAGATVGINYSVTGASSMPVEIAVLGMLYP